MSGKNGTTPVLPVAQPEALPEMNLPQHAHLEDELVSGLWKDVPALHWSMDLEDGQFQLHGTRPDSNVEGAPSSMLSRLVRTVVQDEGSEPFQALEVLPGADGSLHHFLVIGFPVGASNGVPHRKLAGVAIDVTRQKQRVDELAQQALLDELTGLYNLRGFMLFAAHELKVARRRQTLSALLYIDVDGLKAVNDARGHAEGDALLAATATLLRNVFRECDVIARLGGDEFAVLASDVRGDPHNLARRLRSQVPVAGVIPGSSTGLTMSIGVAICPANSTLSLADLVAAADRDMYRNKARKRAQPSGTASAAPSPP